MAEGSCAQRHLWPGTHSVPLYQATVCCRDAACRLPARIRGGQVLEKLYRLKWGRLDGLGALVISPTRELALQIFDELRRVGARHSLSAGLLIGGKNVREERERVNGTDFAADNVSCGVNKRLQKLRKSACASCAGQPLRMPARLPPIP